MFITNSIPYILFTLILFLFSIDEKIFSSKKQTYKSARLLFINTTVIISIYFIGCRGFIGKDWYAYFPFFKKEPHIFDGTVKVSTFIKESPFEYGYAFFTVICKTLTDNYFSFQFICFLLDFLILHLLLQQYCEKYYFLGLVLFWTFQGFALEIIILRNTKAIMLFLISMRYVEKRNPIRYFLVNFLGLLFHSSAIIYIPLYFIFSIKRHKKLELIFFIIGVFIYILQLSCTKPILTALENIMPYRYGRMIKMYLNSDYYSNQIGITLGFIERFLTFCLLYKFSDRIIQKDNRMKKFWYLFLIYSYTYLFMADLKILIERIPNLFICSYWVLYPKLFGMLKKDLKYIFLLILLLYSAVRTTSLLNHSWAYYDNFITGAMTDIQRKALYSRYEL